MPILTDSELWDVAAPIAVELLGKRVMGIPAGRTRVLYLHRQLENAPTLPLVRLIACAQREAAAGEVPARVLTDAFGSVVTEGLIDEGARREISEAAVGLCEHGVHNLVRPRDDDDGVEIALKNAPRGSLAADGETLGRRKTLARTATGDTFDRILRDPHPDVIANALMNPRMSENLCVTLASRRPITAEILEVISRSKWRTSVRVRRAIVMNPNAEAALACQLVSTLTRVELLGVAHDETLDAEVREAARLLIQEKPPRHIRDTGV
jgi:hypothetical protein